MKKTELRTEYLARRRALPAEEVARRSWEIERHLFTAHFVRDVISLNEMTSLCALHTFLPITRQNEVNTWPIIRRIWQEQPNITIAVSKTDPVAQTLTHYQLTPETLLIENRWGIPEPDPTSGVRCPTSQLDLVLVPLLAFDFNGHRVGYGGGYYDRFLAECRPDCLKIGLSLFAPVEEIDDIEPTDIKLDACVTPDNTYFFA